TRPAVDGHGAAAAHADPAGETVGERGVQLALYPGDNVEHRLALAERHCEGLVAAVDPAAPDGNLDRRRHRLSHRHLDPLHGIVAEAAAIPALREGLGFAGGVGGATGKLMLSDLGMPQRAPAAPGVPSLRRGGMGRLPPPLPARLRTRGRAGAAPPPAHARTDAARPSP